MLLKPVPREKANPLPSGEGWGSGANKSLHSWVNEGKVSEHVLVHAVDECSVGE